MYIWILLETFITFILDQGIALLALVVAIFALVHSLRNASSVKALRLPKLFGGPPIPPRLSYYEVKDNTHAIRDHKLVNHLSLHFRNVGGTLYYEDVRFEEKNKHLEVEILAEQELDIFHDPRDDQKIETGECLRITLEREIGEQMAYHFEIIYQNDQGVPHQQRVAGRKGEVPSVSEPIKLVV